MPLSAPAPAPATALPRAGADARAGSADPHVQVEPPGGQSGAPADLGRLALGVLAALDAGAVVVDGADRVVMVNPSAGAMGVVRDGRLALEAMRGIVAAVRTSGRPYTAEVTLPVLPEPPLRRPRTDRPAPAVRARASPVLDGLHVALVLDDVTDARRVEAVRRDFVANVSHELKTPVGALHLLAEAIGDASDEPDAVRRFATRMTEESLRLARLVQELIDLSRLQGADPLPTPTVVSLSSAVGEAVDRTRLATQAKGMTVVVVGDHTLCAIGDERQIATGVANLLDNAIAYSPAGTRVVVGLRSRSVDPADPQRESELAAGDWVEISVADEGIGIAESDLQRIFERFYRADPARSRATGGTGLGLAIVKHIATNHGGSVGVWSAEGAGSTFTLRLPSAADVPDREEGAR